MKIKEFLAKYSNKATKTPRKKVDIKWIVTITVLAFLISFFFSFISETTISQVSLVVAIIILLAFILIGVIFDMVGIAVTVSEIKTFNSMAAKKIKGARLAVTLIKNASKVSSFCNDVIGDICGIISGSTGVAITAILVKNYNFDLLFTTLIVTAVIAALTIGGKAMGKSFAINQSNVILYEFSKFLSTFYRK